MKTPKLLWLGTILITSQVLSAQVPVVLTPPPWGPAGYSDVRYYYLPDIETYYDNARSEFIYYDDGIWVRTLHLPARHQNYDLYSGYKVVMVDYHGDSPYSDHATHKVKYKKGYRGAPQTTIGTPPPKQPNGRPAGPYKGKPKGRNAPE